MENVRIGAIDYVIKEGKPEDVDPTNVQLGEIQWEQATIWLREDMPDAVKRQTLMHEIVHGMLNEIGHDVERDDEGLVNGLASQLVMLLRDNPDFALYFANASKIVYTIDPNVSFFVDPNWSTNGTTT